MPLNIYGNNGTRGRASGPRRARLRPLGQTGLNRVGGQVLEEFLPELAGRRGVKVYREMRENDPVVGSMFFTIDMLLRSVEWNVEPASDSEEDMAKKEFLEQCMSDMSHTWNSFISEVLSMLTFGWSYHEIIYKRRTRNMSRFDDGKIGWASFPIRAQETLWQWGFDDSTGMVRWLEQQPPPNYGIIRIPIDKGMLFRTESRKDNPEGRSMLRNAYRAWFFKKRFEEIEGIGIERDLAGLPVAHVPPELLTAEPGSDEATVYEAIKDLVVKIRRDEEEGVIFPLAYDEHGNELYRLQLLSTGGSRQFDTNQIIGRWDQRIAMSCLADFILLGHENVGSFALSSDKTDLFAVAVGTWLENIASVINRKAIPDLFKLNGEDVEDLPQIKPGDIETPNLTEMAQFLNVMAAIGVPLFPDEKLESWVRDIAGMPKRSEGLPTGEELQEQQKEEQMQMAQQMGMGGGPGGGQPPKPGQPTAKPNGQTTGAARNKLTNGKGQPGPTRPKVARPFASTRKGADSPDVV